MPRRAEATQVHGNGDEQNHCPAQGEKQRNTDRTGDGDDAGAVFRLQCGQVFTGVAWSSPSLILASVTKAPLGSDINVVQIRAAAVLSPAAS